MATKHVQILKYIEDLPVGEKISVRQVARALGVSEGTAYRAIKEAESLGLVSTIERVGTIRIEKKRRETMEMLTFAEVVSIVDGVVLGGREGLHKRLNKFVIGAMKLDDMMKYVEPGNLLIVGNRDEAHRMALLAGAAVLITGGFDAKEQTKRLADELKLPLISCSYDTFTVASMINRAIYDNLIKKEILRVEDVMIPRDRTIYVSLSDDAGAVMRLSQETGHHHFPVVDEDGVVHGVVSSRDVIGRDPATPLREIVRPEVTCARPHYTLAASAHAMVWDGIHLMPVVDGERRLVGVLTRKDVLKAMQTLQKQPQVGDTFDDLMFAHLSDESFGRAEARFSARIVPQMSNRFGVLSNGVLTNLILEAARRALKGAFRGDYEIEDAHVFYLRPISIDGRIDIAVAFIDAGRKTVQLEADVLAEGRRAAKAYVRAHLWEG
ncbi:MAG: CBS domain-containing protein [Hydrogenibacillus schlegelii]|nr:CBS domain-containing protein [Hydrogenibacillus schlegelii]